MIKKNLLLWISCIMLVACNNLHSQRGVELAMEQYDHLIKEMNADSIALLYTPDGDLGDIVHGRDSIKSFLASFKGIRVLSQHSISGSVKISGDTAVQNGTYYQTAVVNNNDTMRISGEFNAVWYWMTPGEWHIKKMMTIPAHE